MFMFDVRVRYVSVHAYTAIKIFSLLHNRPVFTAASWLLRESSRMLELNSYYVRIRVHMPSKLQRYEPCSYMMIVFVRLNETMIIAHCRFVLVHL
jgi:hypothetical protein